MELGQPHEQALFAKQRSGVLPFELGQASNEPQLQVPDPLVGDHEEVAATTRRVEPGVGGQLLVELPQPGNTVPLLIEPCLELIEEQRLDHLQDVGLRGVVLPELSTGLLALDLLEHGPEDLRRDLRPVVVARRQQRSTHPPVEVDHRQRISEQTPVGIRELRGRRRQAGWSICLWRIEGVEELLDLCSETSPADIRPSHDRAEQPVLAVLPP